LLTLVEVLLGAVSMLIMVPVTVLFAEVLLAVTLPCSKTAELVDCGQRRRLAILIPAHNEASLIANTLRSILPQLSKSDRLIVIADNCTDDTVGVATSGGAEVVVRTDLTRRGKGYALDFGVRHLEHNSPDIVIIIDADCLIAPGAIDRLARLCDRSARPVQSLYLMHATTNAGVRMRIAEFAWVVKNRIRPGGLNRIGAPCHLMGSGMAFPWTSIRTATLATGHIVEDLKLGIDLALAGTPPLYCPDALVTSEFPHSKDGIQGQRTRWEHGHLSVIVNEAPRLFWQSVTQFNPCLFALALDLSVPPLALLTLLVGAVWIVSAIYYLITKMQFPIAVATITVSLLGIAILLSWAKHGRHIISLGNLALAGIYAVVKVPLYAKFILAKQTKWVRSKRDVDK